MGKVMLETATEEEKTKTPNTSFFCCPWCCLRAPSLWTWGLFCEEEVEETSRLKEGLRKDTKLRTMIVII